MVKDKDLKPTGQQFKPEPYIPETETRIILEQQELYPDLDCGNISSQKCYGPMLPEDHKGISELRRERDEKDKEKRELAKSSKTCVDCHKPTDGTSAVCDACKRRNTDELI